MHTWGTLARAADTTLSPTRAGAGPTVGIGRLVRELLHDVLQDPDCLHERRSTVRAALRVGCERARAHERQAEQLLLVVQAAWCEMPEQRRARKVLESTALGLVISMCIEEYYEPGRRG